MPRGRRKEKSPFRFAAIARGEIARDQARSLTAVVAAVGRSECAGRAGSAETGFAPASRCDSRGQGWLEASLGTPSQTRAKSQSRKWQAAGRPR